jgi:NAD(P)-dependent dehydrogenase (short-subunit alcohol dehydrogenase family)
MPSTILITGANRGIGLELVRRLKGRGDRVIGTARNPGKAKELAALADEVVELDVTDRKQIARLSKSVGRDGLDVLINNAGVASRRTGKLETLDEDEFEEVFRVNALAPMLVTRALLPALRAGRRKIVMNISSQLASIANNTGGSSYAYRASKSALNQLNRCLHNELSPEGFVCLAVHPGWVRTDMGGPEAHLSVEESVAGLLGVLDAAGPRTSGGFWNYDGTALPW